MTSRIRAAILTAVEKLDGLLHAARDHLRRGEQDQVVARIAETSRSDDLLAKQMREVADQVKRRDFPPAESVEAAFRRPDSPVV